MRTQITTRLRTIIDIALFVAFGSVPLLMIGRESIIPAAFIAAFIHDPKIYFMLLAMICWVLIYERHASKKLHPSHPCEALVIIVQCSGFVVLFQLTLKWYQQDGGNTPSLLTVLFGIGVIVSVGCYIWGCREMFNLWHSIPPNQKEATK